MVLQISMLKMVQRLMFMIGIRAEYPQQTELIYQPEIMM